MKHSLLVLLLLCSLLTLGCEQHKEGEVAGHSDTTASTLLPGKSSPSEDSSTLAPDSATEVVDQQSRQPSREVKDSAKQETKPKVPQPEKKNEVTGESGECGEITEERIKAGETIFAGKGNCYTCHKGKGTGSALGPDLTDKTWIQISGDYASIVRNIRTGVPAPIEYPTPMPAMGGGTLTEEEICAVGAYVWSLSR